MKSEADESMKTNSTVSLAVLVFSASFNPEAKVTEILFFLKTMALF